MSMKLSAETVAGLSNCMVEAIGERVYDGITYALLTGNSEEDKKKINEYNNIIKSLNENGIDPKRVLQALKVPNGIIFDMNIGVAKEIANNIARTYAAKNGKETSNIDLIKDGPIKRRQEDMTEIVKYLEKQARNGNTDIELALFSRNSIRRIVYTAKDKQGKDVQVKMNAYAIRHWDLPMVSTKLMEYGYKIAKAQAGEILPSKTGVRFEIQLTRI